MREALGDGVIITRGDDAVSINGAMLTSDVTRLGEAVDAGRHEDALALYRGELLAGIHFPNAGEAFEEWLSAERRRVTELVVRAIEALVERDEQAGNFSAAAHWAQRACTLITGDERWLRRAMTLLDQGQRHRRRPAALRRLRAPPRRGTQRDAECRDAGARDTGARRQQEADSEPARRAADGCHLACRLVGNSRCCATRTARRAA